MGKISRRYTWCPAVFQNTRWLIDNQSVRKQGRSLVLICLLHQFVRVDQPLFVLSIKVAKNMNAIRGMNRRDIITLLSYFVKHYSGWWWGKIKRGTANQWYMKAHIREIRVPAFVAFIVMFHYYCRVAQDCELLHLDRKINTSLRNEEKIIFHPSWRWGLHFWNVAMSILTLV